MYSLLLICAMAIGQEAEKNAFALVNEPHVRNLPIAAGKAPEVRLKLPKSEQVQQAITNIGGKHVLTVAAKDNEQLDEVERLIRRNNLMDLDSVVKFFKYDKAHPSDIVKSLDELKAKGAIYYFAPGNVYGKLLLILGTPEVVDAAESAIKSLEQLQDKADTEVISREMPATISSDNELRTLITQTGITSGITITYPKKGKRVVTGSKAHIERIEAALTEKGLLPTSKQTQGFPLSHADATKIAEHLFSLDIKDTRLGVDERNNTITVHGNKEAIDRVTAIIAELDKPTEVPRPGGDAIGGSIKIFQLKYTDAGKVAQALNHLGLENVKIAAEAGSNSIVVRGKPSDLSIIEAILSNLDIKGAAERKKATDTKTATSDTQVYVYRLVNQPASEVANKINGFQIDGANVTAENQTNSVLIQASSKELKTIVRIISALDIKDFSSEEAKQPAPNPAIGTLWTEFAEMEAKSIEVAGQLRELTKKFGDDHPKVKDLDDKLEFSVTQAFELRHKLQQAEAEQLRRQLNEIETRLTKREKSKAAIIKARIDALRSMDELRWDALTKPKPEPNPIAGGSTPASATNNALGMSAEKRELSEAWERVDRKEYVGARIVRDYRLNNDPSLPLQQQTFNGALFQGTALVPRILLVGGQSGRGGFQSASGSGEKKIIEVGDKRLPSRFTAIAPMEVAAYKSERFPNLGVTDFNHEAKEGDTVWAFVPGQMATLTKAKVYLTPGSDFAFDTNYGFGIEANGEITTGCLVCSNHGDFLGIVARNSGSLGACLSAKSIREWIGRTNFDPPRVADPVSAIVEVFIQGASGYCYCPIVKGVVVTPPAIAEHELQQIAIRRRGSKTIFEATSARKSADGQFGLIGCKEITSAEGFQTADAVFNEIDSQVYIDGLILAPDMRFAQGQSSRYEASTFEDVRFQKLFVLKFDETRFANRSPNFFVLPTSRPGVAEALDRKNLMVTATTVSGHWLGAGVGILDTPSKLENPNDVTYQVRFVPAKEILRLVEEETKNLKPSSDDATVAANPEPASTDSEGTPLAKPTTEQLAAAWERVNRKEFVRASARHLSRNGAASGGGGSQFREMPGVMIKGMAFIPGRAQVYPDNLLTVETKQLPTRLAGVTPLDIGVYRSERFSVQGINSLKAEVRSDGVVWAFSPGNQDTLVRAKVFRLPTSDYQFDPEISFGIEAEGKIDNGYVVSTDSGAFLGLIARHNGSLGLCLSGAAIEKWLAKANLEPPKLTDPQSAMVYVRIPNYPWNEANGIVVNGVIVTHPIDANSLISAITVENFRDGKKLTVERFVNTADGAFGLIWCKELVETRGFGADAQAVEVGDSATFYTLMRDGKRWEHAKSSADHVSPVKSLTNTRLSFEDEEHAPPGAVLTDLTGHWVGIRTHNLTEKSPPGTKAEFDTYTAKEILRIINEESKKLASNPSPAEMVKPTATSVAEPTPRPTSRERSKEANEFRNRIKEQAALHRVDALTTVPVPNKNDLISTTQVGAIVNGYAFLPYRIDKDALLKVDEQSLPVQLLSIAPQGMCVYHRERLPKGFADLTRAVKDGEKTWTLRSWSSGAEQPTPGKAFTKASPVDGMQIDGDSGFVIESQGYLYAGSIVFADDGAFLGLVAHNKGSIGVCLSAPAIKKWLDESDLHPSAIKNIYSTQVSIKQRKEGKSDEYTDETYGTIVKGVIVANPEFAKQSPENLVVEIEHQKRLTIDRVTLSPGGEVALLWSKDLTEREGIHSEASEVRTGDYAVAAIETMQTFPSPESISSRDIIRVFLPHYGNETAAIRIIKVAEKTFEMDWPRSHETDGQAVVTVNGRWLGVELPKPKNAIPGGKDVRQVLKAKEVLRIIEEETKKLPTPATPPPAETPKSEPASSEPPR